MSKINVSTVRMECDAQVLNLNVYLVSKVMRAYIRLKYSLEAVKRGRQEYKEVDESGKKGWVDVLDENGNIAIEYGDIDGNMLNEEIMPLLQELVNAFEE